MKKNGDSTEKMINTQSESSRRTQLQSTFDEPKISFDDTSTVNNYVTPYDFGFGQLSDDNVFETMVLNAESRGCAIRIPEIKVILSKPVITTQKVIEDKGIYSNFSFIYSEDECFPRVTPNVSGYGYFKYQIIDFIPGNPEKGYYANQSIAYDAKQKRRLFGIKRTPDDTDDARGEKDLSAYFIRLLYPGFKLRHRDKKGK